MKGKKLFILSALLLCGLVVTSCDQTSIAPSVSTGGSDSAETTISIETPSSTTLKVDEELTLVANVTYGNVNDVVWASSNVAVASVSQRGKVIALSVGTTNISASLNYAIASISITVIEKDVVSVTINTPSKTSIEVGEKLLLTATQINTLDPITWASSDATVASISAGGEVEGLKEGTTNITASAGGVTSDPLQITVTKAEELSISITAPASNVIKVDATLTLEAVVKGNRDNLPVTWESSANSVATVTDGLVTGISVGNAKITAKVGSFSDSIDITIISKYDPVESVTVPYETVELALNQRFEVTPTILPTTASQEFTLSSSNEVYVSKENNIIIGRQITPTDTPVTVTVTAGEKTTTFTVTVINIADKVLPELEAKLDASNVLEETLAKDGNYSESVLAAGDTTSTTDSYDFTVYSDNKTAVIANLENSYPHGTSRISYILDTDALIKIEEEQQTDGSFVIDQYSGISKYEFNDTDPSYGEVTTANAQKAVKLPVIDMDQYDNEGGLSYKIKYELFGTSQGFRNSEAQKNLSYSQNGNTYTLSSSYNTYSEAIELEVTFVFEENGIIKSLNATKKQYEVNIIDYDTGESEKGDLKRTTTYSATLNTGTREVSSGLVELSSLAATSFTVNLYKGYSTSGTPTTTFEVGNTISFEEANVLPETYNSDYDPISIQSVSDETAVTISSYGTSMTAKKVIDNLTITFASKNYTYDAVISIKEVQLSSITYDGFKSGLVGDSIKADIEANPSNATLDATATITSSNASTATITKGSTNGAFTLVATEPGDYTVHYVDTATQISLDQVIKVYSKDNEGKLNIFAENELRMAYKHTEVSSVSNITFTKDANATTGKLSFTITYYPQDEYDTVTETITLDWSFNNDRFTVSNPTTSASSMYFTSISLGYASLSTYGYSRLRVNLTYEDEYSYDDPFSVYFDIEPK